MPKVCVIGPMHISEAAWIDNYELTSNRDKADIIVFTGGADINPALYGEPPNKHTYFYEARDNYEVEAFNKANEDGKFMVGICRGAQLLCALAGGKLIQNQSNPGRHWMITDEGEYVVTNSYHHQAQFPFNMHEDNYKVLSWTHDICGVHEDANGNEMHPPVECEVVFYPKIRGLGIQGHPEWMYDEDITLSWFNELIQEYW